jgi:bile acid-coenzyme A ligase
LLPSPDGAATIPYSQRLRELAESDPDRPAVTCGDTSVSRSELESAANRIGRDLLASGVTTGRMVTIALPNSVDWFVAMVACWKIGAVPQPVSSRLPEHELAAILELTDPAAVIGLPQEIVPGRPVFPLGYTSATDDAPLPDAVSPAWKAPTSGGSTGRPKIIVSGDPSMFDPELDSPLQLADNGCMVMPGPLYHNGPIVWSCSALMRGNHVVVLPRFDAEATLAAIEEHRADIVYLVPTMMKRIWRLPIEVRTRYDLSSLRIVWHLAEPCPVWLKEAWIGWLGPDRIYELYGGTEAQLTTIINGTEWLAHRGSVGQPTSGEITIRDEAGTVLGPRESGEVWLKTEREIPPYHYIGAMPRALDGGWESLGDIGYLDEDGYLYLNDRRSDMILVGGSNVYPAEVEAVLLEHPSVSSCAVIGLPDEDKGNVVHAVVQIESGAGDEDELRMFLTQRLLPYKVPRTFEFVTTSLRDDAGKVRRSELRAQRLAANGRR